MRSRIAGLAVTLSSAAFVLAAGCGGGSPNVTGAGGHAGAAAGTSGAGTSGAGTSGAGTSGAGTSGAGTSGGGAGGSAAGGAGAGGTSGNTDGGVDGAAGAPTIPAALAVPAGAVLKFKVHATGNQVYTCAASVAAAADGGTDAGATTYAWTLKAPDAKLFDANDAQVGTHFAGPTWMSTDGSDVVGLKVAQADSPLADAIPWLLLKAVSHMGSGVFMDVTFVQRLNTTKGKAPATGCDAGTVNTELPVAYTADYYFYKGGAAATDGGVTADWPFATVTIPAGLATPAGTTLKLKLHALGAQVYTCTASGGADAGADAGATTYAWTLKAPDAKLYDDANAEMGVHSAGPTWTHKDGSAIVGARLAAVDSPLTDAIQWLELKAASHSGTSNGVFSDVTYVQRLNTTKGKAPATGCDAAAVNTDTRVSYTADYYFYTGDAPADGGADGG
jgi:hypothetical protein